MPGLGYLHVDVFSAVPFAGNSLPVFYDAPRLPAGAMLSITRELRHFESIFLHTDAGAGQVEARIFDLFEELPFAGHPLIGAAAALQHLRSPHSGGRWIFDLAGRSVAADIQWTGSNYFATLDQGKAEFFETITERADIAAAFALTERDLDETLPLEVGSTGLRYLVVPIKEGRIQDARIPHDITDILRKYGAQFAVLLDPVTFEIRHWNNDGLIEDVATGSAGGVVGAYLVKHRRAPAGEPFTLSQGRFTGRPSRLHLKVDLANGGRLASVQVGGAVSVVGHGRIDVTPEILVQSCDRGGCP